MRAMTSINSSPKSADPVVVIGAGLGGLTVALQRAAHGPVIVLAKRELSESATAWAQGGIVGVLGLDDSVESHVRDTQEAGAGIVDEKAARYIAEQSAAAVQWLVDAGVHFSPDPAGPSGLPAYVTPGLLFDVHDVLERVPVHAQAQFELLHLAIEPMGQFEILDMSYLGAKCHLRWNLRPRQAELHGPAFDPMRDHCIRGRQWFADHLCQE